MIGLEENEFDLNVPRYVNTYDLEEAVDTQGMYDELDDVHAEQEILKKHAEIDHKELNINL